MIKALMTALLPLILTLQSADANAETAIRPFKADSLQEIEQANQGQPFVLVLWSLDCVYCKASLKYLAQESKRRKLNVVTLATDSADDPVVTSALRQRLAQAGLRSRAWAFGDAAPEQLRYTIDQGWYGELPRSYWYGPDGQRKAYSGVINASVLNRYWPG